MTMIALFMLIRSSRPARHRQGVIATGLLRMAVILVLLIFVQQAQAGVSRVTNLRSSVQEGVVTLRYDLESPSGNRAQVRFRLSVDGGQQWREVKGVSGDIGPGIEPGRDKRIVWSIGKEYPKGYTGPVIYEVQTRAEREQGAELAVCAAHFAANRLTTGVGGNAASCYAQLLQREPGSLAAVRGLDAVAAKYRSWAEAAIAAGRLTKAKGYLNKLKQLNPEGEAVQQIQAAIGQARQRAEQAAAKRMARAEQAAAAKAAQARQAAAKKSARAEQAAAKKAARVKRQRQQREAAQAKTRRARQVAAVAQRKRQQAQRNTTVAGIELVRIPGGSFQMGSNNGDDDEKPVHRVRIGSFRMGKYEVTVGQFRRFVEATQYRTEAERGDGCTVWNGSKWNKKSRANWKSPGFSQGESSPVVCVSWNDAQAMIRWLNRQTGEQFRLASESEWEYAARAGSTTKYSYGNDESRLCRYGNGADQSTEFSWRNTQCSDGYQRTAPVGSFQANGFGLYDLHGNVWEWVQDKYHDSYRRAPTNGSAWESSGKYRVLRGGSWLYRPGNLRSAGRNGNFPGFRNYIDGFRLVQDL